MRDRVALLIISILVLCWGLGMRGRAAAQESPALIAKTPIALKNVEGRINHFSLTVSVQSGVSVVDVGTVSVTVP